MFNFVLQRLVRHPLIMDDKNGLNYEERVALSDTLHVMGQSTDVFKNMLKVLKTPTDSQLLNFLRYNIELKHIILSYKYVIC